MNLNFPLNLYFWFYLPLLEKAAEQFQNVLNIDYSCVEAYIGKADAYIGLNDFNSADSILRKGWVNTWNSKIQAKTPLKLYIQIFHISFLYCPRLQNQGFLSIPEHVRSCNCL